MPAASQPRVFSKSQIKQTRSEEIKWIRSFRGNQCLPGQIASSILGGVPFENPGTETSRPGKSKLLTFDPPRLRSYYEITSLTVTLPLLFFKLTSVKEKAVIEGQFGWVVKLIIGGATYYSEPVPPYTFTLNNSGAAKTEYKLFKPTVTQQLQFSQSIVVPRGASVEVEIFPFWQINFAENGGVEEVYMSSFNETTSEVGFVAVLGYTETFHP